MKAVKHKSYYIKILLPKVLLSTHQRIRNQFSQTTLLSCIMTKNLLSHMIVSLLLLAKEQIRITYDWMRFD